MQSFSTDVDWELDRKSITLRKQLGIGEFGPIYDAELQLGLNTTSRAVVKVHSHTCTYTQIHHLLLCTQLVQHNIIQLYMYVQLIACVIIRCIYTSTCTCRYFAKAPHRIWCVSEKKSKKLSKSG